jgi:hypothetical protein
MSISDFQSLVADVCDLLLGSTRSVSAFFFSERVYFRGFTFDRPDEDTLVLFFALVICEYRDILTPNPSSGSS